MAPSTDISLRPAHVPHWLGRTHTHVHDTGLLTMPNPLTAYYSALASVASATPKSAGDYTANGCRRMSLQSYGSSQSPSPTGSPAMVPDSPAADKPAMFRPTATGHGFSVYGHIGDMPHHEERIAAALRRMVVHKDDLRHVPLFAWGRMTMTIKDARERTLELWKPKRHEIVAVVAAIHMRCHAGALAGAMPPGYVFAIEDGEGTGALQLQARADDFVGLQVEIDTHWGVHKKAFCPAVRSLARMGPRPAGEPQDVAMPQAPRSRKSSASDAHACPRPSAAVAIPHGFPATADTPMLAASCPSRLEQGAPANWLSHRAVAGPQRPDDASVAMALLQLAGGTQQAWQPWPSPSPPASPTLSLASDASAVSLSAAHDCGSHFTGPSAVSARTAGYGCSPPPLASVTASSVRHHPYAVRRTSSGNVARSPPHVPWRPWATD